MLGNQLSPPYLKKNQEALLNMITQSINPKIKIGQHPIRIELPQSQHNLKNNNFPTTNFESKPMIQA